MRGETIKRVLVAIPWIAFAIAITVAGGIPFSLAMIAIGLLCTARVPGDDGADAADRRSPPTSTVTALIVAAHFGTAFNVLLVLAASFPVLFAFGADRKHRDGITVSMGVTLLGIVWIGIPLVHAVLLRDLPDHGAALLVDVLVGTFASDTGAYATGRMFGSHRIAPSLSPNKTIEGLIGGFVIGTMALLVRRPLPGLADRGRRPDHRRRGRRRRPDRRPLRVDGEARPRHQGHRPPLRPPRRPPRPPRRGLLHDRRRLLPLGPARLLTSYAEPRSLDSDGIAGHRAGDHGRSGSYLHSSDEETGHPRRDRVDRDPGAADRRRLRRPPGRRPAARDRAGSRCSRQRASTASRRWRSPTPRPRARARSAWDGRVLAGEEGIRELIAASGADLVLNGIVGAAGLGPTVVALSEGIDVALANKESLVIGGELTMALAEATGARLLPVDSEHSALFQLIAAEPPGTVDRLVLTASGGPVPRPHRPRRGQRRGRARAPDLADGGQDHGRLGDADEQGLRGDRGPPPVRRPLRADRGRHPPAVDRPLADRPQRRRHARPPRLPRHAGPDLLRAALPRARRRRRPQARPRRRRRAHLRGARHRDLRLPAAGARGRPGGRQRALRAQRRRRGRGRRLPRGADPVHGDRRRGRGVLDEMPARPVTHFEDLFAIDEEARRRTEEQIAGFAAV